MIKELIKNNRNRLSDELQDIHQIKFFSSSIYISANQLIAAADKYARGRLLDVGCGHMPFRRALQKGVEKYDSLDIERRVEGVTYVGSALDMHMIGDGQYDTVICSTVLEHVPRPFQAVKEMRRVLKKDGIILLSVPHMSRLHEIPHDYFRFTEYGIREMLEKQGFTILQLDVSGSFLSFCAHQFSTVFVCLFWRVPLLKQISFLLNKYLVVLPVSWIEGKIMQKSLMPLNYFCVAKKN